MGAGPFYFIWLSTSLQSLLSGLIILFTTRSFLSLETQRAQSTPDWFLNQITGSYSPQLAALFNFKEATFVWPR